jgi:hypothetical protein
MTIYIVSAGNIYILGLATLEKEKADTTIQKSRYYNTKKQILQYKKADTTIQKINNYTVQYLVQHLRRFEMGINRIFQFPFKM